MVRKFSLSTVPLLPRRGRRLATVAAVIIALIIAVSIWVNTYTDYLWFSEVGYTGVFSTVLRTKLLLFVVFGLLMALIVGANLVIAYRLRPDYRPLSMEQQSLERYRLMLTPRFGLITVAVATVAGLIAGISAQGKWRSWLLYWNSEPFGVKDPQFGKDISFYVFEYPMLRYVLTVGFTAVTICLLSAVVVHYLYGGLRIAGHGPKLNAAVIVHLSVLLGILVALKSVSYYLDRYGLLTSHSSNTKIDGASAVDVEYLLPAKTILLWIAALCAVLFFINIGVRRMLMPGVALALVLVSAIVAGGIVPALANQFSIKPNANTREERYIERNIAATRAAYGLTNVKQDAYDAKTTASPEEIRSDTGTLPKARLLDPSVVSNSFIQLQQVRAFYDFSPQLDIDRYQVGDSQQDYVVGVRELNSQRLRGTQSNWINRHTVYTHGYGLVASPANKVDNAGAPIFVSGALGEDFTSDDAKAFAEAVKVKQPRVYYGELMTDYSIVGKAPGGKDREFDRPAAKGGEDGEQINTTYSGKGGVKLDSTARKLLFAMKFRQKNFMLSSAIHDESKVMYVRDPRARVEKVAPFLTMDGDPYPAVVDGKIVWILDGYTTTDAYPYAQRTSIGETASDSRTGDGIAAQPKDQINYVRNSVKAMVDAYDGSVNLYTWDDKDPVLKAWNKAFDGVVKPKSAMSDELRQHLRYPEDMFKLQRNMLASYHVGDPQEFFNGQDFWKVPDDPTRRGTAPQPPYFLLAQFPGQSEPTFQLTSAMSAARRENLAAMVSASYDQEGQTRLQVLELPGDSAIPGPNQAQPKMRNDPDVRRELNLLTSGDSQVVYGNLLTLPVGGGLLYVEPIYVQGVGTNSFPLLEKVLVLFGDKIAYEKTLPEALDKLFGPGAAPPGTPQPAPSPSPSPAPSPEPAPSPSGPNAELDAAVADITKALEALRTAQRDGDFEAIGKAQADLAAATDRYEKARNNG